jgi:bacterioferritin-associated ferredoxin
MYICLCNAITERDIRSCVEEGACSMRELESCLGVGATCGKCKSAAREILNDTRSSSRTILSGTPA